MSHDLRVKGKAYPTKESQKEHKARLFTVINESVNRALQSQTAMTDEQMETMTRSIYAYQREQWHLTLQLNAEEACDLLHSLRELEVMVPCPPTKDDTAFRELMEALQIVVNKANEREAQQEEKRQQLIAKKDEEIQAKEKLIADKAAQQQTLRIKQSIFVAIVAAYFCFLYSTIPWK